MDAGDPVGKGIHSGQGERIAKLGPEDAMAHLGGDLMLRILPTRAVRVANVGLQCFSRLRGLRYPTGVVKDFENFIGGLGSVPRLLRQ